MKIEISEIIDYFISAPFKVKGVYRYVVEPNQKGSQKTSPLPGFIFPIRGQAEYDFSGVKYVANIGNVIHVGPNMYVKKRVVGNKKWECIIVLYDMVNQDLEDEGLKNTNFEIVTGKNPNLSQLLSRLWKISIIPGSIGKFQTETLFRRILEEVFLSSLNKGNSEEQLLFKQASEYINEYYMEAISIKELAKLHGVNENRLFYVFSKNVGMGAGDYLILNRLNHAKEMLVIGDASIISIAKNVGFNDPYHFSKKFKKYFGMPPTEFRKKFRNNT